MRVDEPVNSSDVARLAGVSRSAVSRAFTPGASIAAETREKVMRAAELLHYSPNAIARSLTSRRSGLIGLIASNLENPFYAVLLDELSLRLQARGFGILLLVAESAAIDAMIPKLLSYRVDGVILPAATLSSTMAMTLQRSSRPVVLVNRTLSHDLVSTISGDNKGGGALVADHLLDGGCRRIAFMAGQIDTSSSRDRGLGLRLRLAEHGRAVMAEAEGGYTHEGGAAAARDLLGRTPRPDAIFCANDVMAMAAIEVAQVEFGLRVPEDLSVVGYDNALASGWPFYRLTSVDQNVERMAELAVETLLAKIGMVSPEIRHHVVPASLVRRKSTREGRAADSPLTPLTTTT